MREAPQMTSEIYLAGGCFWGLEELYRGLDGIVSTECGYANGDPHFVPDYMLVCSGRYGFREAVRLEYDPERIPLEAVLTMFFAVIDPGQEDGQGNDIGTQYRTGVYWKDPADADAVLDFFEEESGKHPYFYTEAGPLTYYSPAEEHHQKYLMRNPNGYCHIPRAQIMSIKRNWNGM